MRRIQSIFVIILLASLPVVLLAQVKDPTGCDGMCCVRHTMHARSSTKSAAEMSCHHGAAGHMFECGMHSKQHQQNAMLAPLPPTMLSALISIPAPAWMRDSVAPETQNVFPGFLSTPFEPPRT